MSLRKKPNTLLLNTIIIRHPPPGSDQFLNFFITPPKTFQLSKLSCFDAKRPDYKSKMAAGRINGVSDPWFGGWLTMTSTSPGRPTHWPGRPRHQSGRSMLWSICVNIVLLQFIKNMETITINPNFKVEIDWKHRMFWSGKQWHVHGRGRGLGSPCFAFRVKIEICVSPIKRYRGGCNGIRCRFASCLK